MMNFFRKRLNKKGFTLVELLIVIAVLGIIAGIGVKSMGGITTTFKEKADIETGRQIARQIEIEILAGNIKVDSTSGVAADDIPATVKANYPTPQTGTAFVISVDKDGYVTVNNGTKDLIDETASNPIKIATKKVE